MPKLMLEADEESEVLTGRRRNPNLMVRFVMVTLLAFTFVGAIRWAADVTNANARRVSHNLSRVQENYDDKAAAEVGYSLPTESGVTRTAKKLRMAPRIEPDTGKAP